MDHQDWTTVVFKKPQPLKVHEKPITIAGSTGTAAYKIEKMQKKV